jgi:hypothetical protein
MMTSDDFASDDESIRSEDPSQTSGVSSRGSSHGRALPMYARYSGPDIMCGATFSPKGSGLTFLCFEMAHTCRRKQHKEGPRGGTPGCYYVLQKSTNKFRDGLLSSEISEAAYHQQLKDELEEDEAALAAYGRTTVSRTPTNPTSRSPTSWAQSLATGVTDILYGDKEPSPSAASTSSKKKSRRSKRNANVQISEPETLPPRSTTEATRLKEANEAILELQRQLAAFGGTPAAGQSKTASGAKGDDRQTSQPAPTATRRGTKPKARQAQKKQPEPPPSSSSESEDSLAPAPTPRAPTKYWYGIAFGKFGQSGVFENKAQARALMGGPRTQYGRFQTEEEAWEFVYSHTSATPGTPAEPPSTAAPPTVAPVQATTSAPPPLPPQFPSVATSGPPLLLSSKDKSTKDKDELFGISLDVDTKDLRNKLAPPGLEDDRAGYLMECMVDAVSLPGKTNQSSEGDDLGSNIHTALAELISSTNLNGGREDMNRDLKWRNQSRQALKGVKDATQLKESLKDVLEIKDRTLRSLAAAQRKVLSAEPWSPLTLEAWSQGGFVTVISRNSIDYYISLLQHLVLTASNYGWEETQRLIDHHVKEWQLIRAQSHSRLMALCHIYVTLRDGAEANWLSPTLEAAKLTALFLEMAALKAGGGVATGTSGSPRHPVCTRCGTMLHGTYPCFVQVTGAAAKKKGQYALRKLARDGAELADAAEE